MAQLAPYDDAMARAVAIYDAMLNAITQAASVSEVKPIRDKAVAVQHYARQARNLEAERKYAESAFGPSGAQVHC